MYKMDTSWADWIKLINMCYLTYILWWEQLRSNFLQYANDSHHEVQQISWVYSFCPTEILYLMTSIFPTSSHSSLWQLLFYSASVSFTFVRFHIAMIWMTVSPPKLMMNLNSCCNTIKTCDLCRGDEVTRVPPSWMGLVPLNKGLELKEAVSSSMWAHSILPLQRM